MKKIALKALMLSCLVVSFGMVADSKVPVSAFAKTQAAKVVKHEKIKRTSYHANGGILYTSTTLTKKSAKQVKNVKTTLFASKSARIKKNNGKQATYYFVKNKRGDVKGWLWKGNLNRTKNLAQRASDLRRFKVAYWAKGRHGDMDDLPDEALRNMPLSHVYNISYHDNKAGMPSLLRRFYAWNPREAQGSLMAYAIFKGRFDAKTNAKLLWLKNRVQKEISQYKSHDGVSTDNLWDATNDLGQALSKAVHTLG